jgi:hypothetical protein
VLDEPISAIISHPLSGTQGTLCIQCGVLDAPASLSLSGTYTARHIYIQCVAYREEVSIHARPSLYDAPHIYIQLT